VPDLAFLEAEKYFLISSLSRLLIFFLGLKYFLISSPSRDFSETGLSDFLALFAVLPLFEEEADLGLDSDIDLDSDSDSDSDIELDLERLGDIIPG
jgi:hypothetical protein